MEKNDTNSTVQSRHTEWSEQWILFQDDVQFLFEEWIAPVRLEDFEGKNVLECGCGGGQHTALLAPLVSSITAVDLNTTEIAKARNSSNKNVRFVEEDIAQMNFRQKFDIVFCIGVIHHTDNPDLTFRNILKHCKVGGKVIIWTYSYEGNKLVLWFVEPIRKLILRRLPRPFLVWISKIITALIYIPVYSIYLLPIFKFLPYYEYFKNFRRLFFERNTLNVFDKLNAPQTKFTSFEKCRDWFNERDFEPDSISIRRYTGTSYSLSAIKKNKVSSSG